MNWNRSLALFCLLSASMAGAYPFYVTLENTRAHAFKLTGPTGEMTLDPGQSLLFYFAQKPTERTLTYVSGFSGYFVTNYSKDLATLFATLKIADAKRSFNGAPHYKVVLQESGWTGYEEVLIPLKDLMDHGTPTRLVTGSDKVPELIVVGEVHQDAQ